VSTYGTKDEGEFGRWKVWNPNYIPLLQTVLRQRIEAIREDMTEQFIWKVEYWTVGDGGKRLGVLLRFDIVIHGCRRLEWFDDVCRVQV
jgi:hypothetical protein